MELLDKRHARGCALFGESRLAVIQIRVAAITLDRQFNQLVLAEALKISAIHAHMGSEIALRGKVDLVPERPG
ncbi:MAG: hypothetical protein WBQ53_08685 [Methylocystis sp.]